jgi:O-antigen/teichoic acid export membrane protein
MTLPQEDYAWQQRISEQATLTIPVVLVPDVRKEVLNQETRPEEKMGAGGYASQLQSLIKHSGIYTLSSLAVPLVALVLAPFLSRHLSRDDYGALAVLNTAIALAAGITQLGLSSAFFRAYSYDYESQNDRLKVLSMVVILLSLITIPTAIMIILAAPWLAPLLLKSDNPALVSSVRLTGVVMLLQNFTVPGLAWMRAENRVVLFVILSIFNLLLSLAANIVLVGVLKMGISGSLMATGLGFSAVAICTMPVVLWRAGLRLHWNIAKSMLSFGLPNVSTFISVWVLQLADRFLLARLGSLSQAATYTIAYSLGSVLGVVVLSPFQLAWPSAMFSIAKRRDALSVFQLVFRWYGLVLLFSTYGLILTGTFALHLFFPPGYQAAAPIIPIIGSSLMFYGVYNYMTLGMGIRRKTWLTFIFTACAALFNVVLNLILIPLYGSMGAALATFFAYGALSLIGYVANQRIYPVPFEMGRFIAALFIGVALYIGSNFLVQAYAAYASMSIHVAILCLYGGCLVVLGKLPPLGSPAKKKSYVLEEASK